jgi:hypothetical protein
VTDVNDWNTKIIEEFHAHEGKVGGQFEGAPVLLLHTFSLHTGGVRRTRPGSTTWSRIRTFASRSGPRSSTSGHMFSKARNVMPSTQNKRSCTRVSPHTRPGLPGRFRSSLWSDVDLFRLGRCLDPPPAAAGVLGFARPILNHYGYLAVVFVCFGGRIVVIALFVEACIQTIFDAGTYVALAVLLLGVLAAVGFILRRKRRGQPSALAGDEAAPVER